MDIMLIMRFAVSVRVRETIPVIRLLLYFNARLMCFGVIGRVRLDS